MLKETIIVTIAAVGIAIAGVFAYNNLALETEPKLVSEAVQTCTGPVTTTCNWNATYFPEGTTLDDYVVDIEIVDIIDDSLVFGPLTDVNMSEFEFTTRFNAEPGIRYACRITTRLKEGSGLTFCYASQVQVSQAVGLCRN